MKNLYLVLLIMFITSLFTIAQVPQTTSFQGVLTDSEGIVVSDGDYSLNFKLYNVASSGTMLWEETQTISTVGGVFNVILGKVTILDLPFDEPYWIEMGIDGGEALSPRVELTSSFYSLMSKSVEDSTISTAKLQDEAVTTEKLADGSVTQEKLSGSVSLPPGGEAGGDLVGSYPNPSIANDAVNSSNVADNSITQEDILPDMVSSIDGVSNDGGNVDLVEGDNITIAANNETNTITISAAGVGSGDITSVTAGEGLIGGGTSADVTLNIVGGDGLSVEADEISLDTDYADSRYVNETQANSINSAMITDNTITSADISTNMVSSIDGVINDGGDVNLVAGSNVTITPNNTANTITIAATGIGGGDITSVNAGAGLTGGGTAADVTLNIGSGNGITVAADAISLNTTYTDGRYVNEGQANSVTSSMITDGQISISDLGNNSVNSSKIADNSITQADIATNVVSSIDGVSYDGGNVDLVEGSNITIIPNDAANTITIAAATGAGDNLGNHTATQNLELNGNYLSGDGGDEGLFVTNTGNVGIGISNPISPLCIGKEGDGFFTIFAVGDYAGVYGEARDPNITVATYGGVFKATGTRGRGVVGNATNTGNVLNYGGYFTAAGGYSRAVYGLAYNDGDGSNFGGYFAASGTSGYGVYANASGLNGYGVYGTAGGISGRGVIGIHYISGNTGVLGHPIDGVHGESNTAGGSGLAGIHTGSGNGIYGSSTSGHGVYGTSASGYAGYFWGNVFVKGTLSKGAGSFQIDHPLDPVNKNLYHSFVESPDMMNIYNGNTITDGNGNASIVLPEWFEVLNKDFRYQLTVIGEFAQAIISQKISNNSFSIKTDKPNIEVSWQVTGIRQDAFAIANRIPVEEMKKPEDRGKYLHPEAFGMSVTMGVDYDEEFEQERVRMKQQEAERERMRIEEEQRFEKQRDMIGN